MAYAEALKKNVNVMMQQALASHAQGDIAGAVNILSSIISLLPQEPDALNLRGTMYYLLDNVAAAEADQSKAVELDGEFVDFRINYALTLRKAGRYEDSERQLQHAIRLDPKNFKANLQYGQLLYEHLSRYKDALPYLHLAVQLDQSHVQARRIYGSCLLMAGEHGKALPHLLFVHGKGQADEDLLGGIATCHYILGNAVEAQEFCSKILHNWPDSFKAHFVTACVLADGGKHNAAIAALQKALRIDGSHFEARQRMVFSLLMQKDYTAARKELDYWQDKPELAAHPAVQIQEYNYLSGIGDFLALRSRPNFLKSAVAKTDPLFASSLSLCGLVMAEDEETSRKLFSYQREWGKFWESKAPKAVVKKKPLSGKRPRRIGLLSSDFREHSVGKFLLPLIDQIDGSEIEFYGYSLLPGIGDKVHSHFQKSMKKFTDMHMRKPVDIAAEVAADKVEILIDLNGMTMGGCGQVMAWRCAPLQMSWLGYPFSSGLKDCDYMILDQYIAPENDDCLTEQKLILQDSSYLCFGAAEPREITSLPMDKNGYVTFGSLNNIYKLAGTTLDLWRSVLKSIPDSRLLLVRPEFSDKNLLENVLLSLTQGDIARDRILLKTNYSTSHLDCYNDMDIALDTFPVTGGTTTMESLWMGVPVVSRFGPQIHQRVSYSILNYAGLGELCAADDGMYLDIAKRLVSDPARLREWRKSLRSQLQGTSLIDTQKFAAAFTEALLSV